MDRSKEDKAAATADPFRPVVFLWPVNEPVDLAAIAGAAGEACGVELSLVRGRRGTGAPARRSRSRRSRARSTSSRRSPEPAPRRHTPVRIIADFGPTIDAKGNVSDTLIARLSGASDMVGLPASTPIATLTFAARARAEPLDRVRSSRSDEPPRGAGTTGGDGRPLASREVYAVSFTDRRPKRAQSRRQRERR